MISRAEIQLFVDQVVERFKPVSVILFGSYAYGDPTEDSDVDLMVVMRHQGSGVDTATKIRLACPRPFAMDLMVRTPAEMKNRIRMGDPFFQEVQGRGVVLYEDDNARVGR